MIPWFYSINQYSEFHLLSPKKRQKIIDNQRDDVRKQKAILDDSISKVKASARSVQRRAKRNDKNRATEEMMTVAFTLKNMEPVLTNYVNSLLILRMYQTMHIEGYVDPSALPEAMEDIDYGLYSVTSEDELDNLLRARTDPLAMIGITFED